MSARLDVAIMMQNQTQNQTHVLESGNHGVAELFGRNAQMVIVLMPGMVEYMDVIASVLKDPAVQNGDGPGVSCTGVIAKIPLLAFITMVIVSANVSHRLQEFLIQIGHLSFNWATEFSITVLEKKSSILQIFPHSKSGCNPTIDSKVMAKKLTFRQQKVNFLSITFEPVV